MGREAVCTVRYRGESAEGKALLETGELILRGAVRARIPRARLERAAVEGGTLTLIADGSPLELDLGEKEAAAWLRALAKAPPTLAEKLGVGPARRAYVPRPVRDAELQAALAGAMATSADAAAVIVAELDGVAAFDAAVEIALAHPLLPVWFVQAKGKASAPTDADVRTRLRALGYVDTKSCAVSARMTATRYARRRS
jgi:hypothetical protein